MKILIVDDEWAARQDLERVIRNVVDSSDIYTAVNAAEACRHSRHNHFDVVFMDIQLPDTDGLTAVRKMMENGARTNVIMQTAYPQFALEAYELYVCDYVVKPVTEKEIRKALENLRYPVETGLRKLKVQCFGNFEVYWGDTPIHFGRKKAKEMFAYIIDRGCTLCSADELAAVLWEGEKDMEAAKTYLRRLIGDLRETLSPLGFESLLIRKRGQLGFDKEMIDCDYYRYLSGDEEAVKEFKGEYMSQYTWASETEGTLYFDEKGLSR